MFIITVQTGFVASHQLNTADGDTEPVHSHDWIVRAAVSAPKLDKRGIAMDFRHLKDTVDKIIAPFRNAQFERLSCFQGQNASTENIARYVYEKLEQVLPAGVKLRHVEITEACGFQAKYSK